jgi:hypothetical protein
MALELRWFFLSPAPLQVVCQVLQEEYGLPDFRFDAEIDSQWGLSEGAGVTVNVTRINFGPRERLEELTHEFPEYNFLLTFSIPGEPADWKQGHWVLDRTVADLSRGLGSVLGVEMNYMASPPGVKPARFLRFRPG